MACIGRRVSVFTCVLLLFCVVLLVSFPAMSFAGAKVTEDVRFSLDFQNERLGGVCEKISQATGYEIVIDPKWEGVPVSVSLKDVSLNEALMRILGKYNTAISVDNAAKKCEVMFFGRPGSVEALPSTPKGNVLARSSSDEIIPPGKENGRGLTVKEIDAMMKMQPSPEQQVVPPDFAGKRGLTVREIDAMMKIQPSPGQQVVPPDFSGKRGLTVREIEAMMVEGEKGDGQKFPVLPPPSVNK